MTNEALEARSFMDILYDGRLSKKVKGEVIVARFNRVYGDPNRTFQLLGFVTGEVQEYLRLYGEKELDLMITSGVINSIFDIIKRFSRDNEPYHILISSALHVVSIPATSKNGRQRQFVLDLGLIELVVSLLDYPNDEVKRLSVWTLVRFAPDRLWI